MRHLLLFACTAVVYAAPTYEKNVRPVLVKYCGGCHNAKLKTGNVDLTSIRDTASAVAAPEVFEGVARRLKGGTMPPKGLPKPPAADVAMVREWIEATVKKAEARKPADPGRVTARRLNQYEYNRTVEDLLAIRFRPADDFPADDAGYGFDNIGDVLSLSPVLMEKYMAAAETISKVAAGASLPRATVQRYRNSRSRFSNAARHRFVYDAEYEIRAALAGRRHDGAPWPTAVVLLDGKEIKRFEVDPQNDRTRLLDTRVHVEGGDHEVQVKLLADEYQPDDPANKARNVVVDYIEVRGPYAAAEPGLTESQKRVYICGHLPGQHLPECPRRIVSDLARRAWRRPVTAADVDGLLRFVETAQREGDSMEEGVRVALEAMLVSPHFLFRIERDPAPESPNAVHQLNEFELASRLSYFIWSSMPDEALFAAAEAGTLSKPETLRAQVQRMLADPKSSRLVENFGGQWLELRNLEIVRPDPKRFPEFDSALRSAMRLETTLFFESLMRDDRAIMDFIDARYTFLNERLARHYGIEGVKGSQFRKVDLEDSRRGGILTQGSVLTVSSYPTRTSPVLRGKWLLENILGEPPPPPPPDVPSLDESKVDSAGSLRKQMEQHRENAVCASCHSKMDPLGFAFENYNAIGKYRSRDGEFEIDASGVLPDGKSFRGAAELKELLKGRADDFTRCLTEKMLTYALGRGLERYDRPAVDAICNKMSQSGYRFSTLVTEIASSMPFRMRRKEGTRP